MPDLPPPTAERRRREVQAALDFLQCDPDFSSARVIAAYDELPLWSAMFGLLLLEEVPLARVKVALDIGCATGFPLIELAERLGSGTHVHGLDPWAAAMNNFDDRAGSVVFLNRSHVRSSCGRP